MSFPLSFADGLTLTRTFTLSLPHPSPPPFSLSLSFDLFHISLSSSFPHTQSHPYYFIHTHSRSYILTIILILILPRPLPLPQAPHLGLLFPSRSISKRKVYAKTFTLDTHLRLSNFLDREKKNCQSLKKKNKGFLLYSLSGNRITAFYVNPGSRTGTFGEQYFTLTFLVQTYFLMLLVSERSFPYLWVKSKYVIAE